MFSIKRVSERCLLWALTFCTFYDSYRYPLQMNSTGTSPTYSDTPASFQAGKFLVTLVFCLIASGYIPFRLLSRPKWLIAVLSAYLSMYAIVRALASTSGDGTRYLDIAFWPLAALVLVLAAKDVSQSSLNTYFKLVFWAALVSTGLEVFLFARYGRLPALAYEGSFSVRFGGFLDDPNGFSALLYMLMGWAYYHYSGRKRFFAEMALILCLLLTQSFTAIGFFALLAFIYGAYHVTRKPKPLLICTLAILLCAAIIPFWTQISNFVSLLLLLKNGSIGDHTSQFSIPVGTSLVDLFSGASSYLPLESWWFGSLLNMGLIWFTLSALLVLILIGSAWVNFRRATSTEALAVSSGIFMMALYFGFANINLPLFTVFPVNFVFFGLTYLVYFDRISNSHEAARKTFKDTDPQLVEVR